MRTNAFFVILLVLNISCDTTPTSNEINNIEVPVVIKNLTGTWNWVQTVDSTDQVVDETTLNNFREIIITQDYTFREFLNDTLIFDDKFKLVKTTFQNENDTLTYLDWSSSKRFNIVVYSLKSKNLKMGYSFGNKYLYSRVN